MTRNRSLFLFGQMGFHNYLLKLAETIERSISIHKVWMHVMIFYLHICTCTVCLFWFFSDSTHVINAGTMKSMQNKYYLIHAGIVPH